MTASAGSAWLIAFPWRPKERHGPWRLLGLDASGFSRVVQRIGNHIVALVGRGTGSTADDDHELAATARSQVAHRRCLRADRKSSLPHLLARSGVDRGTDERPGWQDWVRTGRSVWSAVR